MYDAQGSIVCRSCLEDHYNHSDCMDTYLSSDAAREVYDSAYALRREQQDDYCTHSWGRSNLRTWDGLFVTQNAYDELYDEDRDEDDEDRDEDNDGLVDYHSSFRNFREQNSTPAVPALGVELEVYAEDRGDCVESVKNEMPNDWIFERDASLCESYGFEIISQPYGPTEWAEHAVNLLRTLNNNDACGYSGDAGSGYGIHINVHRRNLSPLQEARLMMFLLVDSNREFVKSIAQRDQIYGSSLHQIGSIMAPTIAKIGGLHTRTKRKPQGLGKYCPLNLNNDIAEFRLFQSTLYLPSFMKNLEFVWALVEWTNVRATTGTSTDHMQFVMWLGATSERIQRYPHLVAYLRKPSFLGIGFEARIKNTWRHLLPVTTTKSHDVVSGNADLRLAA
ncbi:hypothetical protein [Methylotenera sp.]|uniref:hypothetical protein n=1 Tax=Methylotenera sp. TaxID=2051956 RepID=UPI002736BCDF|nr:hypothetical protein [Methylotenera sp.]MDP3308281.1 hypothetical protein [Methylotenera sp.]